MSAVPEKSKLHERARLRLSECSITAAQTSAGEPARSWRDNLAPGISTEEVEAAYSADPAWRADLALPHSSAALTVNLFAPWRDDLDKLTLGEVSGFTSFRLEVEASLGLDGTPAYFDAIGMSDRRVVAIEVKCLEYLSDPPEKYRIGFEQSIGRICEAHGLSEEGWLGEANRLKRDPAAYGALFAHQLVKQAFALEHQHKSGRQLLIYLYWEPTDWQKHPFFEQHRSELARLSRTVAGERIAFRYLSVSDLIAAWAHVSQPAWLAGHVEYLKHRYEVEIGNIGGSD